ncbi:two-component system, OmpR family, phosphate regulon sensor histidine kinase PhoR [bacterium A37T11]|nr:two-component system, OmpR family, phosphate regulon sensor histidine kinase PhoR [bacterium A37T11]
MGFSLNNRGFALLSFIILFIVLFYLTYNTFTLKDKQYKVTEKELINKFYTHKIINDKLYPGAQAIFDKYIMPDIQKAEKFFLTDKPKFQTYRKEMLINLFVDLRKHSNMDSIFLAMKKAYSLDSNLRYLLTVNSIKETFGGSRTVDIFNSSAPHGFIIDGDLDSPVAQNMITSITVSSPKDYNYCVSFSLYADRNNRLLEIIKTMLPIVILTLSSIALVFVVFLVTYRNWERQKQLADLKTDFVNSITHEFHTPISTIMVANKNLQNDKVLDNKDRVKSLTEVIFRQSKRLETLFSQVLDITRMDNVNLEKEEVLLEELLFEIVQDYKLKILDGTTDIYLELDGMHDYVISLNRFWFTTMVFNIFDNAVKYNDKVEKSIVIKAMIEKGELQVQISDNGVGMEGDTVKYIFDKFYRANKKQMTHVSGLGLGLYYAQQCIRVHGWKMSVKSEINVGSNFVIYIS